MDADSATQSNACASNQGAKQHCLKIVDLNKPALHRICVSMPCLCTQEDSTTAKDFPRYLSVPVAVDRYQATRSLRQWFSAWLAEHRQRDRHLGIFGLITISADDSFCLLIGCGSSQHVSTNGVCKSAWKGRGVTAWCSGAVHPLAILKIA